MIADADSSRYITVQLGNPLLYPTFPRDGNMCRSTTDGSIFYRHVRGIVNRVDDMPVSTGTDSTCQSLVIYIHDM